MTMDSTITGTTAEEEVFRDLLGVFKGRHDFRRHECLPAPTLNANLSNFNVPFQASFPYQIYRPKPLIAPSTISYEKLNQLDQLSELVSDSKKWEEELHNFVVAADKSRQWADRQEFSSYLSKVSRGDKRNPIYTTNPFIDLVKHLENEPVPGFCGLYNWLATGGCLTHCSIGDEMKVIVPSGEFMDKLNIVNGETRNGEWSVTGHARLADVPLPERGRIFQVIAKSGSNTGLVAVRQKEMCSVLSIKQNFECSVPVKWAHKVQTDKAIFTSMDICLHHKSQLCTLDSERMVKVWDLHAGSCIVQAQICQNDISPGADNWGCVKLSDNGNEILLCDRSTLRVKDLRAPLSENIQEFSPKALINNCEELSYVLQSLHSNFLYLATTHFLLNLDIRAGFVQRWTHFLHTPPVYGAIQTCAGGSDELIVLSTESSNDCNAFMNSFKSCVPESFIFPAALPSLGDTLLWAQAKGKCLGHNFSQRLKKCTAGITLLPSEDGDTLTYLSATSIGDVFSQVFARKSANSQPIRAVRSENPKRCGLQKWEEWEEAHNAIYSKSFPSLHHPVVCRERVFESIKVPLSQGPSIQINVRNRKKTSQTRNLVDEQRGLQPPDWNETINELKTFRDLLAPLLLEPWLSHGEAEMSLTQGGQEILQNDHSLSAHELAASCSSPSPQVSMKRQRVSSPSHFDIDDLDSASVLGDSQFNKTHDTPSRKKKAKREPSGF